MPELLDKWLKTTTEPELTTDLLSGWLASTEAEPEKELTWWGEAWEKTKGFGEWLFPRGIQDLPRQYGAALQKGGMAAGEAMTWLTRLLPGNEDRKPYAEQTTAEQAWTVAQAGATIGAVATAIGMGIDTIKGLKTYLKGTELQKAYKEYPYTKEMVEKGVGTKYKPIPRYKFGGLKGKKIPGAKASILRPGVEVTRVVKPAKPEIATVALKQLSQKVQAVEMVKKADMIDDFTLAIKQALTAKTIGTQATQTAINNAAQTITNDITAVIPAQFSGEFAVSLVNEAINKLDLAANIISTGMEYTEPKYTRPIEEEIVDKELAKPLEEVSPYGEKFIAPEPEAKPTIMPQIAPKAELPPSIEQEVSMGGGPITGMGLELTDKTPYEYREKNTFQKAINNIQKSLSVYTRIKKENPEGYQLFRNFKGGEELALINAREINEAVWGKITQEDALAVQRARQIPSKYPRNKLTYEQQETLKRVDKVLEDTLQEQKDMDKLKVGWPQSYIEKLDKEADKLLEEVELLTQPKAIQKRQTRIIEIEELKKVLSTRQFFPAGYMEKAEKQSYILSLLPEGAYKSSRIRSKFRAGKFITDIDQAIEWGLEPLDPRAGMMQHLTWLELEKNKWVLYEGIKSDPTLAMKPTKNNPAPEHFMESKGISDLKGYWLNPLVHDVLNEFERVDNFGGLARGYAAVARYGKMASFHNPIIMPIYDTQQGYMAAGLRVLNPITLVRSLKSVLTKDEIYKRALGADLFPKPVDLGPQRDMDKFIISVAKQMDKDVPEFTRLIEKATNGEWNFKGKSNTKKMLGGIKGLYNMLWNLTWGLDASSRLTTIKTLGAQGWEFDKAVERARFYHADYGDVPAQTRRFANYFMWTPSYQLSMAKVYGNMAAHPIKERGPLLRLIAFQLLMAAGMAVAGYKWQQGNKFVKDIKGTDLQDVISSPGPLYWFNKQLFRNPLNSMYWQSAVPINIIWSMERNFDGLGNRVYDPKADMTIKVGQIAKFALERYFRPLETKKRLTDNEVSLVNRLMSLAAISKYQRKKPKEKKKEVERWWE